MEVRNINHVNYLEIRKWWKDWGWPPVPYEFLPPDGFIISKNGQDLCAAWLYHTNTPICWAEHYISNKDGSKADRKMALDYLMQVLYNKAKDQGFKVIMSSLKGDLMKERLEVSGFQKTDNNMTHYLRVVN